MEILGDYLSKSPTVGLLQMYHGGMTDKEKDDVLEKTQTKDEKHQILLIQLQSGGVGLNLQHFTKVVFMSPWWTAALMDQAIGRAVRIGQGEIVEVTLLVLKEEETMNIDRMMLEKAEEKGDMLKVLFQHASRGVDMSAKDKDKEVEEVNEAEGEDPN
jgi:SNF2 family DNA or RNA helicase